MMNNSPFPGMDPYLEAHWGDVHHRLITYSADQLQAELPADLRARVEERVYMETPSGAGRSIYPDVRVVERPAISGVAVPEAAGGVTIVEPISLRFPDEEVTEGYLEIREAGGGKVITIIEFISLANKQPGEGRSKYQQKQQECRDAGVNLVEIDLLRAGARVFRYPQEALTPQERTPYRIFSSRANRPDWVDDWPVSLASRLPLIRIPLRPTDADVGLDLQAVLNQAYRNGRYDDLDYTRPPNPPLEGGICGKYVALSSAPRSARGSSPYRHSSRRSASPRRRLACLSSA